MDISSTIIRLLDEHVDFSDVHAQTNDFLRVRIDGDLKPLSDDIISDEDITEYLKHVMVEDPSRVLRDGKGDAGLAFTFHGARFRCEISWQGGMRMPSMVMRRLNDKIPSFANLGLPPVVESFAKRSKGLVIITGQTGSGKTTTLASLIDGINSTLQGKIVTIEDPIEYIHVSKRCMISQREIGHDTSGFSSGLRAAVRQDPDVIMIGELRDKETMNAALAAAETGHLVFATLHTPNAKQTIERIAGFYEGEEKAWIVNVLSSVLIGIVSQVLLKKAKGGRCLGYEILVNNEAVAQQIRENKVAQIQNNIVTGKQHGMVTLNAVLAELVRNNEVTVQEALYAAYDVENLRKELGLARP